MERSIICLSVHVMYTRLPNLKQLTTTFAAHLQSRLPPYQYNVSSAKKKNQKNLIFTLIYTTSRQLRSSSDSCILCIPSVNTKLYGACSFSYIVPTHWNILLNEIRFSQSAYSYKSALKTHLFPV